MTRTSAMWLSWGQVTNIPLLLLVRPPQQRATGSILYEGALVKLCKEAFTPPAKNSPSYDKHQCCMHLIKKNIAHIHFLFPSSFFWVRKKKKICQLTLNSSRNSFPSSADLILISSSRFSTGIGKYFFGPEGDLLSSITLCCSAKSEKINVKYVFKMRAARQPINQNVHKSPLWSILEEGTGGICERESNWRERLFQ